MEIGFIGLGHMGFPMARRLIEADNRVVAFDTRAEALDRVVALGAQAASSPNEVADLVETVMASLPSPQAALDVANQCPRAHAAEWENDIIAREEQCLQCVPAIVPTTRCDG